MTDQKQESKYPWEIKGMFYPERAAGLGFSVLEACVIARLTAFTNFGAKPCFYSNSNLMKDFNVSLSSAVRTFNFLVEQSVVSIQLKETSKSKVKQREVFLNLKHELFADHTQNDHVQNDNGVKKNIDHCQNDNDHVQNDNGTIVKMTTLNRSINSIDNKNRSLSLKKENIKEKTETTEQPTLNAKKDEGLPQDGKRVCRNTVDGSTTKQPTPYRNTVDPYIYEEGRSKVERKVDLKGIDISVEKSTQKTKTTEQQGSSLSKNQENTDSMFLPQDLLPEELKQSELMEIKTENPLNCDADPQNIAINTPDGTNTHTDHRSPLKTKSERSESVSKKPARNRKVKNPEFDEQGNKIFYVKDNPPTLEQTVSCMQNIADKFFNNLLIDRKAVQEDIAFLDSLNLRSEAERCFEHYQSNGWVINTGDYLKNWYMTCRRWISKKIDQSWIQWERDKRFKRRSYTNNGTNQRTYGETLNDFQGRVIDQINRIGQGMFDNQPPELEYGQHNLLNNGGNQRK